MLLSFTKYSGCGNDFILIDNRENIFPNSQHSLIPKLCHRKYGIGADGIILLGCSENADFHMRIFNSDGSEAEMCGNGLRCLIQWLKNDLNIVLQKYAIEIKERIYTAFVLEHDISIEMGLPRKTIWNIPLSYQKKFLVTHHIDIGVPHTIFFTQKIELINMDEIGPYIRHHFFWKPLGTNVTIAQMISPGVLKIRTYERGVEGETLACGTGATAAALAAAYQFQCESPLKILTLSGEALKVEFIMDGGKFSHIILSGPAHKIYKGEMVLKHPHSSELLKKDDEE